MSEVAWAAGGLCCGLAIGSVLFSMYLTWAFWDVMK
jgi:hypothetical protein